MDNLTETSRRLTSEQKWLPKSFPELTFTFNTWSSSFFSESRNNFSKNFFVSSGIISSFVLEIVLKELRTELYSWTTDEVFLRNFPFDFGEDCADEAPGPGLRNFLDFDSSGESVGLLPGNRKETIEFFLDPGLSLFKFAGASVSLLPPNEVEGVGTMQSLLLAGVILTLELNEILNARVQFNTALKSN